MDSRSRRHILQSLGVVSLGVVTAGCVRVAEDAPMPNPIQRPTPNLPRFLNGFNDFEISQTPEPALATRFGPGDGKHQCIIFAENQSGIEVTFTVRLADKEESFWKKTTTVSHQNYALLEFSKPADYVVTVQTPSHTSDVFIPEDRINCNTSVTGLVLQTNGGVKRRDTPLNNCNSSKSGESDGNS